MMTNKYQARTMAELITPKQLNATRCIGTSKNIDHEAESRRIYQCAPEELNIRTASNFITYLSAQPRRWITHADLAA
jgi:hypothetical protein